LHLSDLVIHLTGVASTRIMRAGTGDWLHCAMAPEYGGPGGAFSSTDLLAAALGSCIATNLAPVADRHGVPLDALIVRVRKELGQQPRRVTRLDVEIQSDRWLSPDLVARLRRAAASCTVSRSLRADLVHPVHFNIPAAADGPDSAAERSP
jgi:uncharacterized OsmC-like protein